MGEFSLTHLLLLTIIALIFFGPSRLPQLGQGLGKAIRGFKQGLNEIDVEAKDIHDNAQRPQQQVNHQQQAQQSIQTETQKQTETQNKS
jgi:sec-independent protein translocase protein TatA